MAKQIPEPIFCVWIPDEENTTEQLYDRISGKSLTRSNTNLTSIAYDNIDNFRCLQFTANNAGCVYQILLSELDKVYNSFKHGEYTVVTFMSFPPDSYSNDFSHRWGWMCTYNSAQIFGWTTNSPNVGTSNPKSGTSDTSTFIIPFDESGDRTHLGMIAKSVSFSQDRAFCTFKDENSGLQNDITKFNLKEYNELSLGNSSFKDIAMSNYLIIGRSQESSYYAGRNTYSRYVGFAIYDKALDAEQLKYIYDNKKLFSFPNPNIIEVPDISILKGGQLLSLRDQKIKKDGVLHTFGVGSGVKYGENLYVLGSEGEVPIAEMTTTASKVSFVITKIGDIEIDWGDGFSSSELYMHEYTDGLESHNIKFYGANDALIELNCNHNQLTSLDVTKCTGLTTLNCQENQLTSLDVEGCTKLAWLYCNNNLLTSLKARGCTALIELNCGESQVSYLDLSGCIALKILHCYTNQLTSLDLSGFVALTTLSCNGNKLTSLNISKNTALEYLNCRYNELTSLDVSKNTKLKNCLCSDNQLLTSLDVSGCIALTYLSCGDTQITSLDVSGCMELNYIHMHELPPILLNQSDTIAFANTLCDRTGKDSGEVYTNFDENVHAWIQDICTAKNWIIK